MRQEQLVQYLDNVDAASNWLKSWGVKDLQRAHSNLVGMAQAGVTLDLIGELGTQLAQYLPACSDPDMSLNNLERFVSGSRNPIGLASLIERDQSALPILVQIFSTSQYLSDILIQDPESYDLLRITEGQPAARQVFIDEICSEVAALPDRNAVMLALRRYKWRETLRIAYGDVVQGQSLEIVTQQISFLADAICEAAWRAAWKELSEKRGVPRGPHGEPARFAILGLGKLGGNELNYSSDIDLMLLYDVDGNTDQTPSISNQEFFDRLSQLFVTLLTESSEWGSAYRVDLRLRPTGKHGPIVVSLNSALHYYDVSGRTWERQAFVKARPVAGDVELAQSLLDHLETWIYRRYLSRVDITGIKALKRRIEKRTRREGGHDSNVKTGYGGIRDIEFVIQFLQLLNGGDLPEVRTSNTLEAIQALEKVGCLTTPERNFLEKNYRLLRNIEHRLQIMFDLQTHSLPSSNAEFDKLARRLGYDGQENGSAGQSLRADYQQATDSNHSILNHLLFEAFDEEDDSQPEVDLVLDPEPSESLVEEILGEYGFQHSQEAYQNLNALATERIPFLSTRRCRHFLAAIAPNLLPTIAVTPDPDFTLVNLARVSDSLGGKGVLWELFSVHAPSLRLYVRLCASSSYLSGILTSHPGMIDELMDSLVLDRLSTRDMLEEHLQDLCRGAEDVDPILHSFKSAQHLRVGVRDILGKEDIEATTASLADVAEVCLRQIVELEYGQLVEKYGEPLIGEGREERPCELVTLAMGKLGGREPNYHSDLDVVFLYEGDGRTSHRRSRSSDQTTNQHFFSELGQRIIHRTSKIGPYGRLYEIDARLRPTGKSGSLTVSFEEFRRYFREGHGQLWERQALCKSRPITGTDAAQQQVLDIVQEAIVTPRWQPEFADEIKQMRQRMQESAADHNLKRGPGGTVDIEFVAQMLQLAHARDVPQVLVPGTWTALAALHEHRIIDKGTYRFFSDSYRFLRGVEARLRLMNTTARHDLPQAPDELAKLAYLLHYEAPAQLQADCARCTGEVRRRYEEIFANMGN